MTYFNQYLTELRKNFKDKYCLIPGCNNMKVIRAHTVQKKGGLSSIAKDGEVYTFNELGKSFIEILRTYIYLEYGYSDDGYAHFWPEPNRIGINKASTITAFCSQHDREIFAPIELERIVPTDNQVRLFALRCLSYELCRKHGAAKDKTKNFMKSLTEDDEKKRIIDIHDQGTKIGEEVSKATFYELLNYEKNNPSGKLSYIIFTMDKAPEIVCSFARFINLDLEPNKTELIINRNLQWITCSCFSKDGTGYILFSWDSNHNKPKEFIHMVLENQDVANTIANLFFYCAENVYFSPSWWESLSISRRIAIEKESIQIMPDLKTILLNSPRKIVNWELSYSSNCGL